MIYDRVWDYGGKFGRVVKLFFREQEEEEEGERLSDNQPAAG